MVVAIKAKDMTTRSPCVIICSTWVHLHDFSYTFFVSFHAFHSFFDFVYSVLFLSWTFFSCDLLLTLLTFLMIQTTSLMIMIIIVSIYSWMVYCFRHFSYTHTHIHTNSHETLYLQHQMDELASSSSSLNENKCFFRSHTKRPGVMLWISIQCFSFYTHSHT